MRCDFQVWDREEAKAIAVAALPSERINVSTVADDWVVASFPGEGLQVCPPPTQIHLVPDRAHVWFL